MIELHVALHLAQDFPDHRLQVCVDLCANNIKIVCAENQKPHMLFWLMTTCITAACDISIFNWQENVSHVRDCLIYATEFYGISPNIILICLTVSFQYCQRFLTPGLTCGNF